MSNEDAVIRRALVERIEALEAEVKRQRLITASVWRDHGSVVQRIAEGAYDKPGMEGVAAAAFTTAKTWEKNAEETP